MPRWITTTLLLLLASLAPILLTAAAPGEVKTRLRLDDSTCCPQHWSNATISVRTVGSSKFARCQVHGVRLPDGKQVDDWIFFDERDHVNVLVRERRGDFVVFRQSKYALGGKETLAPVGGFIEDGETPLAAAKRELHEELGLRSSQWYSLGTYITSANRGGGHVHAFMADHCYAPAERSGGHRADQTTSRGRADHERQDVVRLQHAEIERAIIDGRFAEVKWTATIALALLRLRLEARAPATTPAATG